MKTSGAQRRALRLALESAYPDYPSLELFLDEELDRKLASKVSPAGMELVVHKLIQWSESKGWTAELVTAALLDSPDNPELRALHEDGVFDAAPAVRRLLDDPTDGSAPAFIPNHGALAGVGDRQQLQTMLNAAVGMVDAVAWAVTFLQQAARVCSISVVAPAGNRTGTGFLVGPDLVLTNHHVVAPILDGASPAGVTCRFDYHVVDARHVATGTRFELAPAWLLASSPTSAADLDVAPLVPPTTGELDFALVRLAGSPGNDLRPGGSHRGWVDVSTAPAAIAPGQPLVILQHPLGLPVKWAPDTEGVLAVNANRTRVTYRTNTEEGSSGAPCFAFDLAAVLALHHAGEPAYGAGRNEGIPVHTIVSVLRGTAAGAALGL